MAATTAAALETDQIHPNVAIHLLWPPTNASYRARAVVATTTTAGPQTTGTTKTTTKKATTTKKRTNNQRKKNLKNVRH